MSVVFATENPVKRSDLLFVHPYDVVINPSLRGRKAPPSNETLVSLAASIYDHGQAQPVLVRKDNSNKLVLIAGFNRVSAVRLIHEGFTGPDGIQRQDPEFMVQATLIDANDEQAFVKNIVENAHRNQTSPIDDAHNQAKLRANYGKTDTEIAKLYRYPDQSKVSRLKKLLTLDEQTQELIHSGRLPMAGAVMLADAKPEDRAKIIESAKSKSNGEDVKAAEIKAEIRKRVLGDLDAQRAVKLAKSAAKGGPDAQEEGQDEGADGRAAGTSTDDAGVTYQARSVREIRAYWEAWKNEEAADPAVLEFARASIKFVNGAVTELQMDNSVKKFLGASPSPPPRKEGPSAAGLAGEKEKKAKAGKS